jgi:hypothetical protein
MENGRGTSKKYSVIIEPLDNGVYNSPPEYDKLTYNNSLLASNIMVDGPSEARNGGSGGLAPQEEGHTKAYLNIPQG